MGIASCYMTVEQTQRATRERAERLKKQTSERGIRWAINDHENAVAFWSENNIQWLVYCALALNGEWYASPQFDANGEPVFTGWKEI
jgi:hypothetical protein